MNGSSVADGILRILSERGTGHHFLVPGAQIDPLFTSLSDCGRPGPIFANHELGAGYMADGYARAGGTSGVALSIGVRAQRIGHPEALRDIFARIAELDAPLVLSVPVPLVDAEAYCEVSGIRWVSAPVQRT